MRNIETLGITENAAITAIFDACRANEQRAPRGAVTFRLLASGEHEAALRDAAGVVVALAIVDNLDC
jgi:hypothetical protein